MTFRRLVSVGEKYEEFEKELQIYIQGAGFKINYPDIKITMVKPQIKENTLVIDVLGEGADTVIKKFKNIGDKHKLKQTVKNQKNFVKK